MKSKFQFLENILIMQKREYHMGIANPDGIFSYCLVCITSSPESQFQIILTKSMHDEKEFNEEVNNLSKYFNAAIFKE